MNILLVTPSGALPPYTWKVEQTPRGGVPHFCVAALGPNDVWIGSGSACIEHFDGTSWTSYTLGEGNHVSAIYPVSANNVYAATSGDDHNQYWNTNVYHFDGTSWTNMPRNHNTYDIDHIWCSGEENAWLTASDTYSGNLWKWDSVSEKWYGNTFPQPGSLPYTGLCMAGDTVWACNTGGNVYYGNEAGWTTTTIPDPEDPPWAAARGIAAVSNNDVWVVGPEKGNGANSIFYHFNGASWSKHTAVNDVVMDVHAVSADNVWAIGTDYVYNYDGSSWSRVYANYWDPVDPEIWATAGNVWAIDELQVHGNVLWGEAGENPPPPPPEPTSRTWAHDSVGVSSPATTWYLAEGCTGGDYETWVLVQNPNAYEVTVDLTFMTSTGAVDGPQDYAIPAGSRQSFNVKDYVTDYDVSTRVTSSGGVICERAVYGGGRTWGHDSVGVTSPAGTWFLAEGCTGEGFETWVLVQNPNAYEVTVDLTFMTSTGAVGGPQDFAIPANSRHSFKVNDYVEDYNVSTKVSSLDDIICERAVYNGDRTWGTDSVGAPEAETTWYLAEGCTGPGFETWVLVQNPNAFEVTVSLTLMTDTGQRKPEWLQSVIIPADSRTSFNLGQFVQSYNVSTRVDSVGGGVVCERAMYGDPL